MEMFREITDMVNDAKRMDKRQFIFQVLSFGMVIASAFMIWKGNKWVTLLFVNTTNCQNTYLSVKYLSIYQMSSYQMS